MNNYRLFEESWDKLSAHHLSQEVEYNKRIAEEIVKGIRQFNFDWIKHLNACPSVIKSSTIKHIIKIEFIEKLKNKEMPVYCNSIKHSSTEILNTLFTYIEDNKGN